MHRLSDKLQCGFLKLLSLSLPAIYFFQCLDTWSSETALQLLFRAIINCLRFITSDVAKASKDKQRKPISRLIIQELIRPWFDVTCTKWPNEMQKSIFAGLCAFVTDVRRQNKTGTSSIMHNVADVSWFDARLAASFHYYSTYAFCKNINSAESKTKK